MDAITRLRLCNEVRDEPYSDELRSRAVAALASYTSQVDARVLVRFERAGFERGDVGDGGIVADRYRPLGSGVTLCVEHGGIPVRRSDINREWKTSIRGARFMTTGQRSHPRDIPPRAYSEGVRLLLGLVGR